MGQANSHRRYGKKIAGGTLILLVVIVFAYAGWRLLTPASSAFSSTTGMVQLTSSMADTSLPSSSASAFSLVSSLLAGSPPTLGSANASVTIVEFGDYQCPTCKGWYTTQEASVIQNLVDVGKAKLVWRDFDYFGPDSVSASEAAYAAGEQGKFWQFHDLLFQNQQSPNSGWASRQNLVKFAEQLGLNMTQFNQGFDSGKYDALVYSNHSLGVQAGISETPTFFLIGPNGKVVTIAGGQPESVFEQAVAQLTNG